MKKMTIRDLKKLVNGHTTRETDLEKYIDNLFISSTKKMNHGLFLPYKGSIVDAHDFIDETVSVKHSIYSLSDNGKKGQNIIQVDSVQESLNTIAKFVRESSGARIIGITGSNGKTTTKNIIAKLLGEEHKVNATMGNFNNFIGLPLSISTLCKDADYGVFEVGISEPNEMDGLAKILQPDISIITSISASHMEFYESIEEIKKEKAVITNYTNELAIINGDIPNLKSYCNSKIDVLTFGVNEGNNFKFTPIYSNGFLSVEYQSEVIKTNFIGVDNVSNIYASITLLIVLGYTVKSIKLLFEDIIPAKGRMNLICKGEFKIIDDAYNANPESVKNLLKTIDSFGVLNNKIVILGEMAELGDDTKKFHKEIVDLFDDNSEYILKGNLYREIVGKEKKNVKIMNNNNEICAYLSTKELNNSVIGIKGSNSTKMFEIVNYLDEAFK